MSTIPPLTTASPIPGICLTRQEMMETAYTITAAGASLSPIVSNNISKERATNFTDFTPGGAAHLYINKAGYTATLVACGWAGAVLERVTRAPGQKPYDKVPAKRPK